MRVLRVLFSVAALSLPLGAQQGVATVEDLLKRPVDPARSIAGGETKSGRLADGSLALSDSSRVELWYFSGEAGQRVRVTQRSGEFDTFVHLGRVGGTALDAQNDDFGEGTDSEVTLTLPESGSYVILANAYDGAGRGAYSLTLEVREPAPGLTGPFTPTRMLLRDVDPLTRLGLGQRFGSQLDAKDQAMDDSTRFEIWYVAATAGDTLQLRVESDDFSPALHVGRQGGEALLAEASGERRAAVQLVIAESGMLTVVVRATRAGAMGSYFLDVQRGGPPR